MISSTTTHPDHWAVLRRIVFPRSRGFWLAQEHFAAHFQGFPERHLAFGTTARRCWSKPTQRQLLDPTLTARQRFGFEVRGLLHGCLHDAAIADEAMLLVRLEPGVLSGGQQHGKR